MCNDFDQLGICNNHDCVYNKFNFTISQRIIFPVVYKGIIVCCPNFIRPGLILSLFGNFSHQIHLSCSLAPQSGELDREDEKRLLDR